MKAEDVKQLATNAIETLAAALEAGKSKDLKRYLAAMGRFHRYCRAFLAWRRGDDRRKQKGNVSEPRR
jgi:hypothetical protein